MSSFVHGTLLGWLMAEPEAARAGSYDRGVAINSV